MKNISGRPRKGSRFAYDGLDRVIHERARVSVLTSLTTHAKGVPFGELKQLCGLTDGNLNRHLTVLEEAKLVSAHKGVEEVGRRPCTASPLSAAGASWNI